MTHAPRPVVLAPSEASASAGATPVGAVTAAMSAKPGMTGSRPTGQKS